MLPLLLSLLLSAAHAACPIDADHKAIASGSVVTVGTKPYHLTNASERAALSGVLSACKIDNAGTYLIEYGNAQRKVVTRAVVGLLVWPVAILAIPPALSMRDNREALISTVNANQ